MSIQDDYLFVRFDKYCKTCKHEKLEENEPPCDECLEHPVNLHSHKPVCYEGTDRKIAILTCMDTRLTHLLPAAMGLKNGEAYDARIYIRGKFLWVEWKVGRFMTRSCPYSSTKVFAQNWDLAYTT